MVEKSSDENRQIIRTINHGKSSASELAKHFDVSVRTIQRDIDALCQAGIPICALTGTNGGFGR